MHGIAMSVLSFTFGQADCYRKQTLLRRQSWFRDRTGSGTVQHVYDPTNHETRKQIKNNKLSINILKMNKSLFFGLFGALALASCSSDELVNNGNVTADGDGYLSVNILSTGTAGSRAAQSKDDFEDGTEGENAASTGLFMFFDAAGNMTQTPQTVNLTWNGGNDFRPAVSQISNATVVIAGKTKPESVLVVLNAPDAITSNLYGQNLQSVKAIVSDACASSEDGKFVMSNSVYKDKDGGEILCETSIADKVYKTREEAIEKPADIYVERVLAKVSATWNEKFTAEGSKLEGFNGTESEITLTPVVTGIEVANMSKYANLYKNADGINNYEWAWDPKNKRSYWETTPNSEQEYGNQTYTAIATDFKMGEAFITYTLPNTNGDQKTSILVTAELQKDGEAYDLCRHNGIYYDPAAFLKHYVQLAANEGYLVETTANEGEKAHYRNIDASCFSWMTEAERKAYLTKEEDPMKAWENTAVFKPAAGNNYVKKTIGSDGTITYNPATKGEINAFLLKPINRVWYWKGGKSYYFVNIDQTPLVNADTNGTEAVKEHTYDGVVRNHVYKLNLNSLKGLGTPVFDPTEIIIPEKPEVELWYLAARMNVLKWRIVSQDINFE